MGHWKNEARPEKDQSFHPSGVQKHSVDTNRRQEPKEVTKAHCMVYAPVPANEVERGTLVCKAATGVGWTPSQAPCFWNKLSHHRQRQLTVCNGGMQAPPLAKEMQVAPRVDLYSALPHGCSISWAQPGELTPMGSVRPVDRHSDRYHLAPGFGRRAAAASSSISTTTTTPALAH